MDVCFFTTRAFRREDQGTNRLYVFVVDRYIYSVSRGFLLYGCGYITPPITTQTMSMSDITRYRRMPAGIGQLGGQR